MPAQAIIIPSQVREMAARGLSQSDIAGVLGMHPRSFKRRLAIDADLRAEWERGKAEVKSWLLDRLRERIEEGDTRALIFACKAIAGMRDAPTAEPDDVIDVEAAESTGLTAASVRRIGSLLGVPLPFAEIAAANDEGAQ